MLFEVELNRTKLKREAYFINPRVLVKQPSSLFLKIEVKARNIPSCLVSQYLTLVKCQ